MAHELEINSDGHASFAYNVDAGIPWHRLGKPMKGFQTLDAMLEAAYADYTVDLQPMFVLDPRSGEPVPVEGQYATARINPHTGEYQVIHGGHKGRYTVMQNRETLQSALDVVGASSGDAVLDTCGVLYDGAQFFATIDLGTLVIDPLGPADKIARYMVVRSSHDASTPQVFANTDIRAVCKNTCIMGERSATRVFKCKHTPNMEGRIQNAATALGLSTAWAKEFMATATEMLAIDMTPGRFDKVIEAVMPSDEADTDRKRANRDNSVAALKAVYANDKNAARVGDNGWAAWNAIVEFYDHHRDASPDERALTSMDDTSWVTRKKIVAQRAVLSLA
jgi:phage/plasmid-like protein (TIGR03299 family)